MGPQTRNKVMVAAGAALLLLLIILLFAKGSRDKQDEQLFVNTWHSVEENEYNELTLREDGTYSSKGSIPGPGKYRIDTHKQWVVLTSDAGQKTIVSYESGEDGTLTLTTANFLGETMMVTGPMPEHESSAAGHVSTFEQDLFAYTAVSCCLEAGGWEGDGDTIYSRQSALYLNDARLGSYTILSASSQSETARTFQLNVQGLGTLEGRIECFLNEEADVTGYEMTLTGEALERSITVQHDASITINQPA